MFGMVVVRKLDTGEFVGVYSKDEERALLRSDLRLVLNDVTSIRDLEFIIENNNLQKNIRDLKRTVQLFENCEEPLDSPVVSKFLDRAKPIVLQHMIASLEQEQVSSIKESVSRFRQCNNVTTLAMTVNGISFSQDILKGVFKGLDI